MSYALAVDTQGDAWVAGDNRGAKHLLARFRPGEPGGELQQIEHALLTGSVAYTSALAIAGEGELVVGGQDEDRHGWIERRTYEGETLWHVTTDPRVNDLAVDRWGNIVAVGEVPGVNSAPTRAYALKLSADGDRLWTFAAPDEADDQGYVAVALDQDGFAYIAGHRGGQALITKLTP